MKTKTAPRTTIGLTAAGALAATKMKRIWRRLLDGDGRAEDAPMTKIDVLRLIGFVLFFLWVVRLIGKTGLLMDGF